VGGGEGDFKIESAGRLKGGGKWVIGRGGMMSSTAKTPRVRRRKANTGRATAEYGEKITAEKHKRAIKTLPG